MNYIKEEKALRLYESIGDIDHGMATAALNYKSSRSVSPLKLAFIIAACFALTVMFVIGGAKIADGLLDLNETPGMADGVYKLDSMLGEEADQVLIKAESDIDFFSGEVELIWSDGENYYIKPLGKKNEVNSLLNAIGKGEEVDGDKDFEYKVWISYGDGRVVSPYLKDTDGNVGYASLFDYSPEIVPSEDFVDSVNELLK